MGRRAEARDKLLEAAGRLFWRHGYGSVGVDQICAEAGVNKGSLYHYHRDKAELAVAVIRRNSDRVFTAVDTFFGESGPRERILGYYDLMLQAQREDRAESGRIPGCPFGKLAAEAAGQDQLSPVREAVQAWFTAMEDFLADELLRMSARRISRRRARSTAGELLMLWQGALIFAQTANEETPLLVARRKTIDVLDGIVRT